ncbi:MAG: hypothetical protein H0V82_05940 [Candidatus Protochlamydia sp.]|nr:hypothetical protein [Candidatus Protochlamydia sp.]
MLGLSYLGANKTFSFAQKAYPIIANSLESLPPSAKLAGIVSSAILIEYVIRKHFIDNVYTDELPMRTKNLVSFGLTVFTTTKLMDLAGIILIKNSYAIDLVGKASAFGLIGRIFYTYFSDPTFSTFFLPQAISISTLTAIALSCLDASGTAITMGTAMAVTGVFVMSKKYSYTIFEFPVTCTLLTSAISAVILKSLGSLSGASIAKGTVVTGIITAAVAIPLNFYSFWSEYGF